jgi:hypothetical protein
MKISMKTYFFKEKLSKKNQIFERKEKSQFFTLEFRRKKSGVFQGKMRGFWDEKSGKNRPTNFLGK